MKSSLNPDMSASTQDTHPSLAPTAEHSLEKLHAKLLQHQPVGGDLVAEEDRPHQSVMPAKGAIAAQHAFKEEEEAVARSCAAQATRPTTNQYPEPGLRTVDDPLTASQAGDLLVSPAAARPRGAKPIPQRTTQPMTEGTGSANSSKCPSPTTSTKGTPAPSPNGAPDFREPMKNIGPLMSEAILSTPPMRSSPAFHFPSQTRPGTTAATLPPHTRLPPAAQRVTPNASRARFVNPNKDPSIQGELCRRLEWETDAASDRSKAPTQQGHPMSRAVEVAAGMDRPASASSVSSFQTASSVSRESSLRTAGELSTVSAPAISSVMLAQRPHFGQRSNTSRSEPDVTHDMGQPVRQQAVQPAPQHVQQQHQPSVRDAVRQLRIQAPVSTVNTSGVVYDRRPSLGSTLFNTSGLIGTPSQPGASQHQRVGSGASSPQRHIVVDVLAALNSPFHIPNGAASPPFSDYAGMASPVRLTPGPNGVYLLQSQPVVLTPQPFPATPAAFPHIPAHSPHPHPAQAARQYAVHQAPPQMVPAQVQQSLPPPMRSAQQQHQHVRQVHHQPPAMVSPRTRGAVPPAPSSSSGMSATATGSSAPASRDEVHIPEGLLREKMTEFEWNMIRIMEKTLRHEGPITVGRMGSVLHQRTKQHLLPKLFKHQFGGLKKFVQRHYWRFELESDHPFNPTLRLREPPQEARPMPYSMLVHMEPASFNGALDTEALQECEVDELEIIKLSASVIREFPNVTIGRMGTLLHSRTQNHRLPRIMKAKFGGLKKFYEMHSDIFHVGEDHPFNPQLALRRDWKRRLQQKAQTLPAQRAREKREREVQELTDGAPATPQRPLRPHNISIGRAMPEGMNFMSPIRETPRDMTGAFERAVLPPPQERRSNARVAQRPSQGRQQQQGEFVPSRVVLVDDSGRQQQSFAFQDFVNAVKTDSHYGRQEQEALRPPQRGHQQDYANAARRGGGSASGEEAWFQERMAGSGPSRNARQGSGRGNGGAWQGQQPGPQSRGMRVVQKHSSGWRTSEVVPSSQDVYSEGRPMSDGGVSRRTNAGRRAFAVEHAQQQQQPHAQVAAVASATQAQSSTGGQVGAAAGAAGGVYVRSGWPGRMGSDAVTRYGLQQH